MSEDGPKRLRRFSVALLGGLRLEGRPRLGGRSVERGPGDDSAAGPTISIWSFGILGGTKVRRIRGG